MPLLSRILLSLPLTVLQAPVLAGDLPEIQKNAVESNRSDAAHWGPDASKYVSWSTHTNRLIPVYTFGTKGAGDGIDLTSYTGENSAYRDESRVRNIYGFVPTRTVAPDAEYMDQTDVFRIQKAALESGKKRVILVVFDGNDWVSTRAAAIWKSGKVGYDSGRGTGLHMQDYDAHGTSQFGFMVTSPHNEGTNVDVNRQTVSNPGGKIRGGYDPARGGLTPWEPTDDQLYPMAKTEGQGDVHAYTDSASSATSMTAGIKTYNDSINVDPTGTPVVTAAHLAQQKGMAVGVVTSVTISHATPAAAYAHNVHRDDYQDLARDLLGLPSVAHPQPLPGVDVLLGGGAGMEKEKDGGQGKNFVPGNPYLPEEELKAIDIENGGKYLVAQREAGVDGGERLRQAAKEAASTGKRLFGFYGAEGGNLPFQGSHGDYKPAPGWKTRDLSYTEADVIENPTLAEMTTAALTVLEKDPEGFWLMVEAGDVDWAKHDNNLDAAVGAVLSGDEAVKTLTDWVERHRGWDETVMIVTADHGHYLVIDDPQMLVPENR
ncbi:MAG: alkaline phosphatase [Planctomycetaceae bacterium]|nr:alkaline phosphatase [Planctomycetaceae bacterium]